MNDRESFIARWSRRKRAAADDATKPAAAPQQAAAPPADEPLRDEKVHKTDVASAVPELPFDPATLPPIESIAAQSDIRAFLAPGVPPELTRAALRRAWATDPKVRDFVGLADYDWDFNAPDAITGFGSLEMTDELRRHVEEMVGRSLADGEADRTSPTAAVERAGPAEIETSAVAIGSVGTGGETPKEQAVSKGGISQDEPIRRSDELYNSNECLERNEANTAAQHKLEQPNDVKLIAKRPHGGALPK